ncbi:MAG: hypothetical protein QXJ64_04080 [Thermosphaera sp.]
MACGTPPAVSLAVPEDVVVHGVTSLRVNTLNPVDYANTLERLLKDDELWTCIHRKALVYVKRFDYVEVAKKYLELINRVN